MLNDPFVQSRLAEIKVFDEQIWERRCSVTVVKQFLECLSSNDILLQANVSKEFAYKAGAHIASRLIYFGSFEIKDLLKSIFRNILVPLLQRGGAQSVEEVRAALKHVRFLGLGSPAKSGPSLLYDFRVQNGLPSKFFPSASSLLRNGEWSDSGAHRLVFLEDFCGTGQQAHDFIDADESLLSAFKRRHPDGTIHIFFLVATTSALEAISKHPLISSVESVFQLDDTYVAFGDDSRLFRCLELDKEHARTLFLAAGKRTSPKEPLGHGDCQLLLAFHHNTPNNSLPSIWSDSAGWRPLFPRLPKSNAR